MVSIVPTARLAAPDVSAVYAARLPAASTADARVSPPLCENGVVACVAAAVFAQPGPVFVLHDLDIGDARRATETLKECGVRRSFRPYRHDAARGAIFFSFDEDQDGVDVDLELLRGALSPFAIRGTWTKRGFEAAVALVRCKRL